MKKAQKQISFLPLAVVACFGFFIVWVATMRWGMGLSYRQGVVFLQSAWALASGQGFLMIGPDGTWQAMKTGAPLYPMLLSIAPFLGMSILEWTRILHSVFFAGFLFISGALIFVVSRHIRLAVMGAVFVMLMTGLSYVFMNLSMLPLLMLLMSVSFLFLMISQEDDVVHRKKFLRLSAILAGLSTLVSYTGFVVILAELIFLIRFSLLEKKDRFQAVKEFLIFALILPVVFYVLRYWVTGALGMGMVSLPIMGGYQYVHVIDMMTRWFFPASFSIGLRILLMLGMFILFGRLSLKIKQDATLGKHEFNLASLLSVFFTVQVVLIVGVLLVQGPASYLRELLVTTCWAFAILLVIVFARVVTPMVRSRFSIGIVVLFLIMSFGLLRTIKTTKNFFLQGDGYSGKIWQTSPIAKQVKTLADHIDIYTDQPEVFYFLTQKPSLLIPKKNIQNASFFNADIFMRDLQARKAFILLFDETQALKDTDLRLWMDKASAEILFKDQQRVIIGCRL